MRDNIQWWLRITLLPSHASATNHVDSTWNSLIQRGVSCIIYVHFFVIKCLSRIQRWIWAGDKSFFREKDTIPIPSAHKEYSIPCPLPRLRSPLWFHLAPHVPEIDISKIPMVTSWIGFALAPCWHEFEI